MDKKIFLESLKEGDYIVTSFKCIKNGETVLGTCKGLVYKYIPNWGPDEIENLLFGDGGVFLPGPVIICSKLITDDGGYTAEDFADMTIGVGDGVSIRFMTAQEIEEFNNAFTE